MFPTSFAMPMKRTQFESKNISPPPRNSGQVLVYEACFVNHFLLIYFVIAGTPENYTIRYKNAGTENTARRYLPVPKEPPVRTTGTAVPTCTRRQTTGTARLLVRGYEPWVPGTGRLLVRGYTNHGYRVLDDLSAWYPKLGI